MGCVSLKPTSEFAVEIHVMGVTDSWQRMGIGRALIKTATEHVVSQDTRFLTVKAIAASKSDEYWAAIRASCESVDFLPVEEFPALCSSSDPCLSRIHL
nr:GNAT family N-acetyltransferase [Sinorhizobium sp. Sb3]